MKKTFFLIIFLYLSCINYIFANEPMKKQWFIQVGAYQNLENAIKAKTNFENSLKELSLYDEEREFNNYISLHKREKSYLVLIGPYPSKGDALILQENLPDYNNSTMLVTLHKNSYEDFVHNYKFTVKKITKKEFDNVEKNKLVIDLVNLDESSEKKIIANEKIKTIYNVKEAQKLLRGEIDFHLQNERLVTGLSCREKKIDFPIPLVFSAYFPEENILLFIGEGFGRNMFSTSLCERTKRLPYFIKYSDDRKFRVNGNSLGELGNNRYFIELWDDSSKSYIELIDIGIFFSRHLDTQINNIFWNGNNKLFFIRNNDNRKEYYQLKINHL